MSTLSYPRVLQPGHARAAKGDGRVLEHIVIAESAIGHALPPGAEVHHVDADGRNNARGNLVVCQDRAYHMLLHKRQRALEACGDANAHRCRYCSGYADQAGMVVMSLSGHRTGVAYHRDCNRRVKAQQAAQRHAAVVS